MSTVDVLLIGDQGFTAAVAAELSLHAVTSETRAELPVSFDHGALRGPRVIVADIRALDEPAVDSLRAVRVLSDAGLIAVCPDQECVGPCLAVVDDVVSRPDRVRELVARVRALLRRVEGPVDRITPEDDEGPLAVGDIVLSRAGHRVLVRGEEVRLPLKQFQMLELLLLNAGRVLPRSTLVARVWGPHAVIESNTLEVQMRRLRRVVEADPRKPTQLKTVRGIGYLYSVD